MSNIKRSSIVGFHNIKNKVSRNAFDLSHRHMFTAQIGELLPIFVQWVNPNETFKLGYNGMTRTQPLQTAAFTRLRENVQYFFVPFQSLWKYFEQQVNNMTVGQSGENISRIAKSATEDMPITTGMPYINYSTLDNVLSSLFDETAKAIYAAFEMKHTSYTDVISYLESVNLAVAGRLRYVSIIKLLRSLGYLNSAMDTYDMVANAITYYTANPSNTWRNFQQDKTYGYTGTMNYFNVENSPNLSIFPLLAYNKIVQDHYLYRQWQPYSSYLCNIDYLSPNDSMNFAAKLGNTPWMSEMFTLKYSNLPLDYFNGVLPKAQYGDESAVSVDMSSLGSVSGTTSSANAISTGAYVRNSSGVAQNNQTLVTSDYGTLQTLNQGTGTKTSVSIDSSHSHTFSAQVSVADGSLKISALRSAIALQKYKEIQESNDSDFASQVLAHFGVKPKHDDYKSYFIGGADSSIDINPQINQNLADDNDPVIKANGVGTLSVGCKFTSDTFGIIIGIYRCVPQLDLAKCGIDRCLMKTDAADFPIPELDSIGMQSTYRVELCAPLIGAPNSNTSVIGTLEPSVDMARTYGYLPRYAEYKTSYDRFEGAFLNSLKTWVTGYRSYVLEKWSQGLVNQNQRSYLEISELLQCKPEICDSLFLDQTHTTCDNDQLLIGSVNTCVAIRPLSVYGLPYSK